MLNERSEKIDIFLEIKPQSGGDYQKKLNFIKEFRFKLSSLISRKIYKGNVKLNVKFFFKNIYKGDVDNLLKSLLDALKLVLVKDDNQIKKINAEIIENCFIQGIAIIIEIY